MKRILVIKLSSLGDLAHALPAVHALKERTGAAIDWVVQPEYAPLVRAVPGVERAIEFPRRNAARGGWAFMRELRRDRYDAIVDLQGLLKSAIVSRLARGSVRYGPAWAREGAHLFYDVQAEKRSGPRAHAVLESLDVVDRVAEKSGNESEPPAPRFAEAASGGMPGPRVAFAPFSRWETKNWPLERFAELGRRLVAEMGCEIRIVGGAGDAEQGEALARLIGDAARSLCGKTDLPGTCSLLKSMDLLVTVDSGPMHWADAMGVPLIAVFGSTDPDRTGPYHQRDHVVARRDLECRPCHSRRCARNDLACLRTLEVESVFRAAMDVL